MMPESSVYGTWPQSGEIDLAESRGNEGASYPTGGRDSVTSAMVCDLGLFPQWPAAHICSSIGVQSLQLMGFTRLMANTTSKEPTTVMISTLMAWSGARNTFLRTSTVDFW